MMPASLLGKRTRSVESPECIQTRSKRRAVSTLDNENCDPSRSDSEDDAPSPIAQKVALHAQTRRKSTTATRLARSSASKARVVYSPNKISAHFPISKSGLESRDEKENTKTTPTSVRYYDALTKISPSTPRHRIQVASAASTPRTPGTPSSAASNVYNQARQTLSRCTNPVFLVGRDDERQELSRFISSRITADTAGCLYVSGPPGTGKSALVAEICKEYQHHDAVAFSIVNCMSVKSAKDLANKLSEDLGLETTETRGVNFGHLKARFVPADPKVRKCLVILDEVDRLVDLDLKLLYSLFEWSMQPSTNLILIGIANALDLTDRLLPRLKSRNLKPHLLPFMPYTAPQIATIITSKLRDLNDASAAQDYVPFLHPAAIQFCSKKVASQTGDLRKAFDICRRAIDLAEQDAKTEQAKLALQDSPSKTPLMENINLASPSAPRSQATTPRQLKLASSLAHLTTTNAPRATIAHMAKVTSVAFSNNTTQRLQTLNLQQKAVLCAIVTYEKARREAPSNSIFATPTKSVSANSAPTTKQLFDSYSALCKCENLLHPLTSMEFRDVIGGLETLSLVAAAEGKNGSFALPITPSRTPSRRDRAGFGGVVAGGDERRLASCVGFQELFGSLQGPGSDILKEIMSAGNGL